MEKLFLRKKSRDVTIYEIKGDGAGSRMKNPSPLKRFIVTTAETREICNSPEIIGMEFKRKLSDGLTKAMAALPPECRFGDFPDDTVCVLHFLRGGLVFNLTEVLHRAFGFNRHYSSFITSQRYRRGSNWHIKYDQYRKLSFPQKDINFFLGDVVATGTTLENGLEIVFKFCRDNRKNIRNFILFTIGCERTEQILERYHKRFSRHFDYENTYVFYVEGKFSIPAAKTDFRVCLPGTDLVRKPALLSPEFEKSQSEKLSYPLERCVVYDISSRAFDFPVHIGDVLDYWKALGKSGMSFKDAYKERWGEPPANTHKGSLAEFARRRMREIKNEIAGGKRPVNLER